MPVSILEHQGHTIVKTTFPKGSDLAGLKAVLAQSGLAYAKLPMGSVLALVLFDGQDFDEVTINLFEGVAKANAQTVKATAFLGIEGPQKALFNAMISISGRKGKLFDKESDALNYLADSASEEDVLAGL